MIISAVLVGIIVIGVFNGLNSASRASSDERAHAQATLVAQQDEERLRGLTVSQLTTYKPTTQTVAENGVCVERTSAWYYCSGTSYAGKAYSSGTVFTVKSSANYVSDIGEKESFTCEAKEGTADYIQTTSSVTWPALGSRAPVSQSSLVAVPIAGALLVKVKNRENNPVAGATVELTSTKVQLTTPESGCVIFGGLSEGTVDVDAYKGEWVDHNGNSPAQVEEKQVSARSLTTAEFTIEEPGSLIAEFESNGASAESFTFVALHPSEMSAPEFFVGGSAGTAVHSTAALTGLFPFIEASSPPKDSKYTVFAGSCEANNPATVTGGAVKDKSEQVEPNETSIATGVEVPAVKVTVYEGESSTNHGNLLAESSSAKIINTGCIGKASQNYTTVPYEYADPIRNGELSHKYLPYAKELELCVVGKISTKYYQYKNTFPNASKTGYTLPTIYLKSLTPHTTAVSC